MGIGAISGALASAIVGDGIYGQNIGVVYAARANGRSAGEQAGVQLLALAITLALALSGGCISGMIVSIPFFEPIADDALFSDHVDWDDVEDEDEIFEHHAASHDHRGGAVAHEHSPVKTSNPMP